MATDAAAERTNAAQSLRADGVLIEVSLPTYTSGKVTSWRTTYTWGVVTKKRTSNQGGDAIAEQLVTLVLGALEASSAGDLSATLLALPRNARVKVMGQTMQVLDAGPVAPTGEVILYEAECRAGGAL